MRKGITGAGTLIVCAAVGWSAAGCEDSTSGAPSVAARVAGETNSDAATRVAYDFLQLVIDSLHARGVDYTAAAVDRTSDLQVPVIAGVDASGQPILAGVRWTDGDAVLVRADVPYVDAKSGVYAASQVVTIGGVTSVLSQGWSSVDATVDGRAYRFVATHLVGQEAPDVQLAQAGELLALLSAETGSTILVGDFNSDAYGIDPTRVTPTYGMMLAAGYRDMWIEPERQARGLTCCQQADLLNARSTFDQRIDFVFTRNLPAGTQPVRRGVVGDRPGDRTASGLWPSDHAGVAVTLLTPAGPLSRLPPGVSAVGRFAIEQPAARHELGGKRRLDNRGDVLDGRLGRPRPAPTGDRDEFGIGEPLGDQRNDLRQHFDLAVPEIGLPAGLDRLVDAPDAFRGRLGDGRNPQPFRPRLGLDIDAYLLGIGLRLS